MYKTYNLDNREKWLEKTLNKLPAGYRILDAGAGELKYKKFCQHLNYVSQDFGQYDGIGNGTGLQTNSWDQTRVDIISDITSIPELDSAFDAVMCVEVLEHVPSPVDVLFELKRLIRPEGYLVLTAPFNSLTHFAPYFYQTGYSQYFYNYWLERLGFEIVDLQVNGNYFDYLVQELYRLPSIAKKYASEKLNWLESKAFGIVINALGRFSTKDEGSSELLSFGLHVFAQKK